MAKSMGHLRDSRVPFWLSGPRTDAPDEPSVKGPTLYHTRFWRPCCRYIIIILFSQPIIKFKKNITLSEKFQKFNRKIVEIGKFDIPRKLLSKLWI
jgi:hypothetical protein